MATVHAFMITFLIEMAILRFLAASMLVAELIQYGSVEEFRSAIESLPSGIDAMYKETLRRIEGQTREEAELAKMAILWVCCAKRPMRMTELQGALGTEYKAGTLNIGRSGRANVEGDFIQAICKGLLVLDPSGEVRLIRESFPCILV